MCLAWNDLESDGEQQELAAGCSVPLQLGLEEVRGKVALMSRHPAGSSATFLGSSGLAERGQELSCSGSCWLSRCWADPELPWEWAPNSAQTCSNAGLWLLASGSRGEVSHSNPARTKETETPSPGAACQPARGVSVFVPSPCAPAHSAQVFNLPLACSLHEGAVGGRGTQVFAYRGLLALRSGIWLQEIQPHGIIVPGNGSKKGFQTQQLRALSACW